VPKRIQVEATLLLDDFAKLDFAGIPLVNPLVERMMEKGMRSLRFLKECFTKL